MKINVGNKSNLENIMKIFGEIIIYNEKNIVSTVDKVSVNNFTYCYKHDYVLTDNKGLILELSDIRWISDELYNNYLNLIKQKTN
jgi:hypothetical protein